MHAIRLSLAAVSFALALGAGTGALADTARDRDWNRSDRHGPAQYGRSEARHFQPHHRAPRGWVWSCRYRHCGWVYVGRPHRHYWGYAPMAHPSIGLRLDF